MKLSIVSFVTVAGVTLVMPACKEADQNGDSASSQSWALDAAPPMITVTTGYAPVNGLEMYYEVHGAGRSLVMLPGAFCTIAFCDSRLIAALETSRQVIAVEPQGMGHTADIDRPFAYEQSADDTVALMGYLGIDNADVSASPLAAPSRSRLRFVIPKLCTS